MLGFLHGVHPLRLAPVSPDTDAFVELCRDELDFAVHEYPSGADYNGWIVPDSWCVKKAEIRRDGQLIYDGATHPLGVWGYSESFHGTVSFEELKAHLAYSNEWDQALVYHSTLFYRPHKSDWGFSVPKTLFHSLEPGDYQVELETERTPGTMKVLDCFLPGDSPETILLNGHNCHAAQANDDMSGCVVGMEIMRRLKSRKRRYSYRLLIAPELYGTAFWLADQSSEAVEHLKFGIMLKSVGNDEPLALQESFWGNTELDRAARHYLQMRRPDTRIGGFRTIYGNDETVFEAPGFEIPSISLTRYPSAKPAHGRYPVPFRAYHSSMDTPDMIVEAYLEETVETVLGIASILEQNMRMRRHFSGLLCLGHPRHDLYMSTYDPSVRGGPRHGENEDWHYLMNCITRYFDERMTILDICERHQLPFEAVHSYLQRFQQKGLISFV